MKLTSPCDWSFQRERTGDFTIYGKDEHGFTFQVGTVLDEDMGNALPALHHARLISAAPDLHSHAGNLIASLDPNALNPEQFIAWSNLRAAFAKGSRP